MDRTIGAKVDAAPTRGSQVIIDRADHLMVRAQNLKEVAVGLAGFILGPEPAAPREKTKAEANSFIGEVIERLVEVDQVLVEAQELLDRLRAQF